MCAFPACGGIHTLLVWSRDLLTVGHVPSPLSIPKDRAMVWAISVLRDSGVEHRVLARWVRVLITPSLCSRDWWLILVSVGALAINTGCETALTLSGDVSVQDFDGIFSLIFNCELDGRMYVFRVFSDGVYI